MSNYKHYFKNSNKNPETMRRCREDFISDLRKNKRDKAYMKRRIQGDDEQYLESNDIVYEDILDCLLSENQELIVKGLVILKNTLKNGTTSDISDIVDANIVPVLTDLLLPCFPSHIQFKVAHIITSIVSGNYEHTIAVVKAKGIDNLIKLLDVPENEIKARAVWALGNIAAESEEFRDEIILKELVSPLIREILNPTISIDFLKQASWLISILCYKDYTLLPLEILLQLYEVLPKLFDVGDEEVISNTLWALSSNIENTPEIIANGKLDELIKYIITLLTHINAKVIDPALSIIANIACSNGPLSLLFSENIFWSNLVHVFGRNNPNLSQKALWCLGNLLLEGESNIQEAINIGLLNIVLEICEEGNYMCQQESLYIFSNVVEHGNMFQRKYLFDNGIFQCVCNMLKVEDSPVIILSLKILEGLLKVAEETGQLEEMCILIEECEGLASLEDLQQHQNSDIYDKCIELVSKYFSSQED